MPFRLVGAKNPRPFLFHFLVSYLSMLFVPVVLGTFAFSQAYRTGQDLSVDARVSMMDHSRSLIDANLRELDEMVLQISLDPDLNALHLVETRPSDDPSPSDVVRMINAKKKFAFFQVTNEFKRRPYVFYNRSQIVLSNNRINSDFDFFFRSFLTYPEINVGQWWEQYLTTPQDRAVLPSQTILVDDKEQRAITYMTSLLRTGAGRPEGLVLFVIDEQRILALFADTVGSSGSIFVTDRSGRTVIQHGGQNPDYEEFVARTINHEGPASGHYTARTGSDTVVVAYSRSSDSGWSFISVTPLRDVLGPVNRLHPVVVVTVAAVLVLGFVAALFWAVRDARPLREVFGLLEGASRKAVQADTSVFSLLTARARDLVQNNQELTDSLNTQNANLRNAYVGQLLRGDYRSGDTMATLLDHIGIGANAPDGHKRWFTVAVIDLIGLPNVADRRTLDDLALVRAVVPNEIAAQFGSRFFSYVLNANEIAILLCSESRSSAAAGADIRKALPATQKSLFEKFGIQAFVGVGKQYCRSEDIPFSFREAVRALDIATSDEQVQGICWYEDAAEHAGGFYFPMELEVRLINNLKAGNRSAVDSITDSIRRKNFCEHTVSIGMLDAFLAAFAACLLRAIGDDPALHPHLERIVAAGNGQGGHTPTERFRDLQAVCTLIADTVGDRRTTHSQRFADRIVKRIHDRYTQWDLSPAHLAEELRVSEYYVVHSIKQRTGSSFAAYLEKVRIEAAKAMVTTSSSTIAQTAEAVGYTNVYTFRRAFKRVVGVVPSAFADRDRP